jgi:hypothetical protein
MMMFSILTLWFDAADNCLRISWFPCAKILQAWSEQNLGLINKSRKYEVDRKM